MQAVTPQPHLRWVGADGRAFPATVVMRQEPAPKGAGSVVSAEVAGCCVKGCLY